ncbi:MAG: phage holin family protein [Armatimonadota bacterium]|nr:phage holin family protein [Armatimonadota bacterium]MDR5703597.1 phage holin family protein [Armatimonadota bacterium]
MSSNQPQEPEAIRVGTVVASFIAHAALFLRRHLDLLFADAQETLRRLAVAFALFLASLVLGGIALVLILTTVVLALSRVLPAWLSSLVVMAGSLVLALIVALIGRRLLRRGLLPRTVETLREDRRWLDEQLRSRKR